MELHVTNSKSRLGRIKTKNENFFFFGDAELLGGIRSKEIDGIKLNQTKEREREREREICKTLLLINTVEHRFYFFLI